MKYLTRLFAPFLFLPSLFALDINPQEWKLTLPIASSKGNAKEILSDQLKDFFDKPKVLPQPIQSHFYFDDVSVVFNCHYTGITTSSATKYSRSEFREMKNGEEYNWKLNSEPRLNCRLKISHLGPNTNKLIFMQIHGQSPSSKPLIKCIWEKGKIKILTKKGEKLKDFKRKESYRNIPIQTWFNCSIDVKANKLSIYLNDDLIESYSREELLKYWPKDNSYYFKAGNYLQHQHKGAEASIIFSKIQLERS